MIPGLLAAALLVGGCAASHHATETARLGRSASSDEMLALLVQAPSGPVRLTKVVAADWHVALSGLVNLDHPAARSAGLTDGDEPIQIYFYVLEHPDFGTYVIDSGLEASFAATGGSARVGWIVEAAMDTASMKVHTTTRAWLEAHELAADGVFLTHLHLDHILGIPDFGAEVPVYCGPGETEAHKAEHLVARATTDALLADIGPLQRWNFQPDPAGRFDAVLDVFGDGSVWALHVPGHTPGSTAFVVRSSDGPQLILGDATHTAWGWRHGVEPGTFSLDGPQSARSLARLVGLAQEVPGLAVHPGHQSLAPARSAEQAD
jgi:N-acyl homoserine lactone hydrolase